MELPEPDSSIIEITGIQAGYGHEVWFSGDHRSVVVDGVSLSIHGGEILAIVAANGLGKTTLLRAVVDRHSRWHGTVIKGGRALGYGEIAYVPQNPALTLSPWKTVLQELRIPLEIRGVSRAAALARIESTLAKLGISLPLDRKVEALSGGQRVKLAIARGLMIPDPELVVLDEPFEGLDHRTRCGVIELLLRVAQSGIAVLLTSHRTEDLVAMNATILQVVGSPITDLQRSESFQRSNAEPLRSNDEAEFDGLQVARLERPSQISGISRSLAVSIVGIFFGLITWHIFGAVVEDPAILPKPLNVWRAAIVIFESEERRQHIFWTVARALGCWVLAIVLSVPIGLVIGSNTRAFRLLSPWLSLGRCLPVFALAGAVIGMFPRMPELQRCFLIWLTLFLIALQMVSFAASIAPRRRWDVARIMGASWWYRMRKILFHESMQGIVSAIEVTLPTSIIVTFVVETTLLPQRGLGVYVTNHLTDRDLSVMYAYLIIPGAFAAIGVWAIRSGIASLRREL
jgi:ABC-type nitrate/sulfonate/bicarbonate transport system ATPase subunit/ABC-type nitrate/sulfonate/bicarbonate transport system permease component